MKKIYYFSLLGALFASTSTLLQAMEKDHEPTHFTVKVWNKDIGPVKGGNFLRDQKWLLEHNKIYGRAPGSGLFLIPDGHNSESRALPLFNLVPGIKIVTKQGKFIEIPTEEEKKVLFNTCKGLENNKGRRLGLPGESRDIVFPVEGKDVLTVCSHLQTYTYSFTRNGGSVWIPFEQNVVDLTSLVATVANKTEFSNTLNVVFSWPQGEPYTGEYNKKPKLTVEFKEDEMQFDENNLDPNWKTTCGREMKYEDEKIVNDNHGCLPTRFLNRIQKGQNPSEDLLKLGNHFSYYAGHSLEFRPFPRKKSEKK